MPTTTSVPDRIIWVSADGNDNNVGSEDAPVQSIQQAIDRATPGTAILVKPGDYTANLEFQNVQGTADRPIWLAAAEGPGSVTITAATGSRAVVTIQGEDNIVIRDLVLVGGADGIQVNQSGNDFTDTVSNIVIQGNTVIGATFDGIKVGQTTNLQILNNVVDGAGDQGIDTLGVVNAVIDGNEIMNVTGTSGLFVKGGSSNVLIANNYIHDITNGDGLLVGGNTSAENFNPGTDYEAKNVVVTGNVVEDAFKRPLTVLGAQDVDIHGNFFGSMPSNAHLVLVGTGSPELSPPPPSARVEIHDNVFDRSTNFFNIEQDPSTIDIHDNALDGVVEGDIRPNPPDYGDEQFVDSVPESVFDASAWSTSARPTRSFTAGSGNQTLTGTSGNDSLSGGSGDDTTVGGAGDDTHTIGSSRDVAVENPGGGIDTATVYVRSYTLAAKIENLTVASTDGGSYAGNGLRNIIRGGAGSDTLRGAGGDDLFVPSGGNDVVSDFNAGSGNGDRVDLRGLSDFRSLEDVIANATQSSGNTRIAFSDGQSVTLQNVRISELYANDFLFSPAPEVQNQAPTALTLSNATLSEATPLGGVLGQLSAVDPDINEDFTYTLLDDAGGRFAIDGSRIDVAASLDYESGPTQNLIVRVTDSAGNSLDQSFDVSLINEIPSSPIDADDAVDAVAESASEGIPVGIIAAANEPGGNLTYSLDDSAGGRFAIDTATGVVTVKNSSLLDYESATEHTIVVRASDASGASSTADFVIAIVNDTSDTAPVGILLSNTMAGEGSPAGTVVGTLAALDPDSGETFSFALLDDAEGRFAIDGNSLVVAGQLDYETATAHAVTVRVTDSDGNFLDQTFDISLVNIEPSMPLDTDSGANQVFESATNGAGVGLVVAAHEVDDGAVTYSLDESADGRFAIDSATGIVTVADAALLDYEMATEHMIVVRASDASGAASTASFTINVADDPADTPPTEISLSNAVVAEGSASGTLVGSLSALDPDADESFVYSLLDNPGGFFAIDGDRLVTAALLDYESVPTHNLTLRVTDSDGNVFDQQVVVSVDNVAPSVPVDADITLNEVSESAANGTTVGVVASAQEVDDGAVTYSLDDSAGGRFAIDATTGAVVVANAALLDFEVATQHTITVRASDGSGAFTTADITVDILDDPTDTPITWPVSGAWTKSIVTGGGNQTVTGSSGNDFMDGGKGVDITIGGLGDDTHYIRDGGDTAVENADQGIDTARVAIKSYTLGANVENLTSTYGSGGVYAGNGLNNMMTGGASNDTLTGGGGADLFVVSNGNDRITDFAGGDGFGDTIDLRGLTAITNIDDVIARAQEVGSDTVLTLDSSHTITLSNFDLADLVTDDFLFAPPPNPVASATHDFMI
jgi:Ca2+-binding RTX toxin-like protein